MSYSDLKVPEDNLEEKELDIIVTTAVSAAADSNHHTNTVLNNPKMTSDATATANDTNTNTNSDATKKSNKNKKTAANTSSSSLRTKTRFVARIKSACIAVPFDGNLSIEAFKHEVLKRIFNHRKLQSEANLLKRLKYIKIQTPNFPQYFDCYPTDKLNEIATNQDMIVFHTESDDEICDALLLQNSTPMRMLPISNIRAKGGSGGKSSSSSSSSSSTKRNSSSKTPTSGGTRRPQTTRYSSSKDRSHTVSASSAASNKKRKKNSNNNMQQPVAALLRDSKAKSIGNRSGQTASSKIKKRKSLSTKRRSMGVPTLGSSSSKSASTQRSAKANKSANATPVPNSALTLPEANAIDIHNNNKNANMMQSRTSNANIQPQIKKSSSSKRPASARHSSRRGKTNKKANNDDDANDEEPARMIPVNEIKPAFELNIVNNAEEGELAGGAASASASASALANVRHSPKIKANKKRKKPKISLNDNFDSGSEDESGHGSDRSGHSGHSDPHDLFLREASPAGSIVIHSDDDFDAETPSSSVASSTKSSKKSKSRVAFTANTQSSKNKKRKNRQQDEDDNGSGELENFPGMEVSQSQPNQQNLMGGFSRPERGGGGGKRGAVPQAFYRERSRRKLGESSHARSISLSGSALLHSGDTKKRGTSRKNTDSVYSANAQDRSSTRGSRRQNAFNMTTGDTSGSKRGGGKKKKKKGGGGGGGKPSKSTEQRKSKYRYGNRNINIIMPSLVPESEELEQRPELYLDLQFVHGYDGNPMESRQNLFFDHTQANLVYTMARTCVMLHLEENTQRHWNLGTEPIHSFCIHPVAPIIVTGHRQMGPDRAKLMVWNYHTLKLHKLVKRAHEAAVLCCQWSACSGYLYTIGANETHMLKMWSARDVFSLDTKNGRTLADGFDSEEVMNADVTAKKKNFVNEDIEVVSDILMGKADLLGFELNPYIRAQEAAEGLIDEFVAFGRKNVKYYEVRKRIEKRRGRNVEMILPVGKTLVMVKLGGKSSEYEKIYHCAVWLPDQHYLLGGHGGTIYVCRKAACLKKISGFHESWVGCMHVIVRNDVLNLRRKIMNSNQQHSRSAQSYGNNNSNANNNGGHESDGGHSVVSDAQINALFGNEQYLIFSASSDGKVYQFVNHGVKLKKLKEKVVYVPRSGNEETGLKSMQPRAMAWNILSNKLYIGVKTNQILEVECDSFTKAASKKSSSQLRSQHRQMMGSIDWDNDDAKEVVTQLVSGINLTIDAHYMAVRALACHPAEPYYVTGSDDHTLRVWDIELRQCISRFRFDDKEVPSCLRFTHSGHLLAVGLTTSKIVILGWEDCNLSMVKAVVQMPFKVDKSLKRSAQRDAKNSEFCTDITVIKFTDDDRMFGAGHIDSIGHIFSIRYVDDDVSNVVEADIEVIPWEYSLDVSNGLTDMQWSKDCKWLLTFTKDQDLMTWFINKEEMTFEHYLYWLDPDAVPFAGDPLRAGWDVCGLFQSYVGWDGTDLNDVALTKHSYKKTSPMYLEDCKRGNKPQLKCKLIASADNKGYIRLHNYPAINPEAHHFYNGHANQVSGIGWTANDAYLISVGGADRSVFQWRLTTEKTEYIKDYKPMKSANSFKN